MASESSVPLWQRVQQGDPHAVQTVLERALAHTHSQVIHVQKRSDHWSIAVSAPSSLAPACLPTLIAQELRRYQMPLATTIRLRVQGSTSTWETEFTLAAVLETSRPAATRASTRPVDLPLHGLDATQRRILLIGLITAFVLCAMPFVRFVLSYLVIIIHELGHTATAWLMGYPAIPAFDFMHGGGVTLQLGERWALIPLVFYLAMGGLMYYFRRNWLTLTVLIILALMYTWIYFTRWHEWLLVAMGHGMELVFAVMFLYRAMTGWACQQPGEQTLYGILGFFILLYDLNFTRQLLFDATMRELYLLGKGDVLDHDFVRIAQEFWHVPLAWVVSLFGLSCLLTPLATWGLYRYQSYWLYGCVRLLRR
ncbi:MAG: M50 family metallopeptidase [Gloeomargarita sp. SKYG116]|nr:M50 family metallopeptidase [Gloeomargarita sp. SKYG116]MDW8400448.1 hypothetical protein [Gloeomargarita sp. SKYGB_i_bin116]